jgi:glutaredoxin
MYKIMPSNINFPVISLVIGALSLTIVPAQANPVNNRHNLSNNSSQSQLVAGNTQGVRRYSRNRVALETEISTKSGSAETAFAQYLSKRGIKFYGAYWCPHCQRQKEMFGKQALDYLPYVECARDRVGNKADACKQKQVRLFPSWEVDGKMIPGTKNLKDLAKITGYRGNTNFKQQ